MDTLSLRRATPADAASITAIWQAIAAEKVYSAIDRPFTIEEERAYIESLSAREAIFLAEFDARVIGFQTLDLWARSINSMRHVAQLGTFVLREWRGRGIGRRLAAHTLAFARTQGYEKIVVFVRASNGRAQRFYAGLGLKTCGRLARQVEIDGAYDDEVLMELFL